jgi:histidine ammonia-lyase
MLVRINTLAHGNSGVSPELIEQFRMLFNAGVTPIIPEHGAVGTSGDLVQLAHIALSIIGEGEVMYRGKRLPAAAVLRTLGIKPHTLAPKEGLSLINGTSVMTGIGALLAHSARALFDLELRIGACELELVHGFTDILDPVLHALRPHAQQMEVAARLRELLADSGLMMDRERATEDIAIESRTKEAPKLLQEVYSLRCIPQIMGPMYAALEHAESTITTEMNSVTDNPIVDPERELCLHGGNFHGDFVATAIDHLKIALVKLSLLSERRINFFLNKNVNQGLPAFLNLVEPGQTLALQGLQFVATSTAAHNQSLAYPHSLHTISTNGDNQDIVSMGTDAALITNRVLENAYTIAAIELVTISQAAEIRKADFAKASRSSRELIAFVRSFVKPVYEDRILSAEVERLKQALIEGNF